MSIITSGGNLRRSLLKICSLGLLLLANRRTAAYSFFENSILMVRWSRRMVMERGKDRSGYKGRK